MSDHWDVYFTKIDNKPASIAFDVDIARDEKRKDYPVLLGVFVKQKLSRPDGLPQKKEADFLARLEDVLVKAVNAFGGIFVGRVTTNGRRDFIFYGPSDAGFERVVAEVMSLFTPDFRTLIQQDPEWKLYFQRLYPTPADWQQIMNRRTLAQLTKAG